MPHFDESAHTDKRCYSVTEAELGSRTPALPPGSTLQAREAEAIADYVLGRVRRDVREGCACVRRICRETVVMPCT
jgi:hypothetical protein